MVHQIFLANRIYLVNRIYFVNGVIFINSRLRLIGSRGPDHFDPIKRNKGVDPINRSKYILVVWFCFWPVDPIKRSLLYYYSLVEFMVATEWFNNSVDQQISVFGKATFHEY